MFTGSFSIFTVLVCEYICIPGVSLLSSEHGDAFFTPLQRQSVWCATNWYYHRGHKVGGVDAGVYADATVGKIRHRAGNPMLGYHLCWRFVKRRIPPRCHKSSIDHIL